MYHANARALTLSHTHDSVCAWTCDVGGAGARTCVMWGERERELGERPRKCARLYEWMTEDFTCACRVHMT